MANKYVDKDNPAALDNVANGSAAAPYLTLAYALTQAAASDTILVAPTATPYDVGATNLNVTKAITFQKWDGVRAGKPEINGGDATRLLNVSTANAVVFDGFTLRGTNAGICNYIAQNRAACRNVRYRNCDFRGTVDLGAVSVESGGSGVVVEDTCTFDMNGGGAVYTGLTGSIECYGDVILRGVAQAAFFVPAGDSQGATFTMGGEISLYTVNNYVYRCSSTNSDARHTIHSSFNLALVPSNYTRSAIDIYNPRSVDIQDGVRINSRGSILVDLGEIWIRSPLGSAGVGVSANINIGEVQIDRDSIVGYGIKVGDESPFSASHIPNSYASVSINGAQIRDGSYYGTVGATITHMIFIGNEKYHYIKNCRSIEGAYGIGIKGDDTADSSSYVYNNYVEGARLSNLKTKGMRGTRWFNNYIFENGKGGKGLDLTENTDDGAAGLGNGAIARNNLFVMDTEVAIFVDAASDLGDNDLDFNAFYSPTGLDLATMSGVDYATLTELKHARRIEQNSYSILDELPVLDDDTGLPVRLNPAYFSGVGDAEITPITDSQNNTTMALIGDAKITQVSPYRRIKQYT